VDVNFLLLNFLYVICSNITGLPSQYWLGRQCVPQYSAWRLEAYSEYQHHRLWVVSSLHSKLISKNFQITTDICCNVWLQCICSYSFWKLWLQALISCVYTLLLVSFCALVCFHEAHLSSFPFDWWRFSCDWWRFSCMGILALLICVLFYWSLNKHTL